MSHRPGSYTRDRILRQRRLKARGVDPKQLHNAPSSMGRNPFRCERCADAKFVIQNPGGKVPCPVCGGGAA